MDIEHANFIYEDTAKYMAEKCVWMTPTLITCEAMAGKYAGFLPPESQAKNQKVLQRGLESLEIAKKVGVKMCYGSDLLGLLCAEKSGNFAIRRRVLDDAEIFQHTTVNAAELLRQGSFLGQIKEGFAAELSILNQNPLDDVTVLGRTDEIGCCEGWSGV